MEGESRDHPMPCPASSPSCGWSSSGVPFASSIRRVDREPAADTTPATQLPQRATSESLRRHWGHTIPPHDPESLLLLPQQCPAGWSQSTHPDLSQASTILPPPPRLTQRQSSQ